MSSQDDKLTPAKPPAEFTLPGLMAVVISCLIFGINVGAVGLGIFFGLLILLSLFLGIRHTIKDIHQLLWAGLITLLLYVPGRAGFFIPRSVSDSANNQAVYYLGIFSMAILLVKAYKTKKIRELYTVYVISLALVLLGGLYAPWKWSLSNGLLFILYSSFSLLYFIDLTLISHRTVQGSLPFSRIKSPALYLAIPLTAFICIILSLSSMKYENRLMLEFIKRLNPTSFYSFGKTVDLGKVESLMQSKRVTIRITTARPHSLVVGRVYNIYEKGRWASETKSFKAPATPRPGGAVLYAFSPEHLPKGAEPVPMDSYRVLIRRNDLIYHRAGSQGAILGESPATADSLGNMWTFFGMASQYKIVADKSEEFQNRLYRLNPPDKSDLQIPEKIREKFRSFSNPICGNSLDPYRQTVAIEQYLQKNYTYQRGISLKQRDMDPVEEFLFLKRPAHCEYFASAMVLLLRSRGIPARYVTGFSAHEYNRPGGYYILREMDAHAWVSVWIENKGWVFFDPTPPGGRPQDIPRYGADWFDYMAETLETLWSSLKNGNFREFFNNLIIAVKNIMSRNFLTTAIFLILSAFLAIILRRLYLRKKAHVKGSPSYREGPEAEKLKTIFAAFEKKLKKAGVIRPESCSLGELALLIDKEHDKNREGEQVKIDRTKCRDFLKAYGRLRYGGDCIPQDRMEALEKKINEIFGN